MCPRYQAPSAEELRELREKHVLLSSFPYERKQLNRGYTDKLLTVDVGTKQAVISDIPAEVKEKFVGGKGYCLRYLWDAVTPETRWDSPENEIVMSPGPIAGITQYGGTGKTLVCTISPLTDIPIDSNVGGFFGPLSEVCRLRCPGNQGQVRQGRDRGHRRQPPGLSPLRRPPWSTSTPMCCARS